MLADPVDAQEWTVGFLDDLLEKVDMSLDRARQALDDGPQQPQVRMARAVPLTLHCPDVLGDDCL